MEENLARAFKNLAGYTIKATEKAILELGESILDKKNESVKSHLEQRQKELDEYLETIRNYSEGIDYVKKIGSKKQSFAPYVDETVEPPKSYLVFCENYSPWDEDEKNMIRVHSNEESHKMLEILEHHFGIKNNHKA